MKQFALDDEYCFVSLSYGYIKHLCTDGYSKKELLDALKLTGWFLDNHLFMGIKMPPARSRLLDRLVSIL